MGASPSGITGQLVEHDRHAENLIASSTSLRKSSQPPKPGLTRQQRQSPEEWVTSGYKQHQPGSE
jgi:hypothetical protein